MKKELFGYSYPYSRQQFRAIVEGLSEVIGATDIKPTNEESSSFSYEMQVPDYRLLVCQTARRPPTNQLVDISYVVLILDGGTDDKRHYFAITIVEPETMRAPNLVPPVEVVVRALTSFYHDSLKPEDEREYKIGEFQEGFGKWSGGFEPLPAQFYTNDEFLKRFRDEQIDEQ